MQILKRLVVLIALVVLLVMPTLPAAAQNQGGSGLSISPLHHRLTMNPGENKEVSITLKNITSGPIVAKAYINDFTSDNSTGNPIIITDPNRRTATSIRDFVSGVADIPLGVGEQKKLTLTVNPSSNVAPGAYYGIVRYQAVPSNNEEAADGQVSLSASVGTIVLVQVEGDLVEKLQFVGLRAYSGNSRGTFFFNKPDQVGVELKNLGSAFAQPFGRVVIENMSGKEVYSYELNSTNPRASILPGSSREFKDKIKNVNSPGRYTLSASVSYGPGSDVLVMQKSFWYIPGWVLGLVFAILLVLLLVVLNFMRRNSRRRGKMKRRS